jgi:hypothetical protein
MYLLLYAPTWIYICFLAVTYKLSPRLFEKRDYDLRDTVLVVFWSVIAIASVFIFKTIFIQPNAGDANIGIIMLVDCILTPSALLLVITNALKPSKKFQIIINFLPIYMMIMFSILMYLSDFINS